MPRNEVQLGRVLSTLSSAGIYASRALPGGKLSAVLSLVSLPLSRKLQFCACCYGNQSNHAITTRIKNWSLDAYLNKVNQKHEFHETCHSVSFYFKKKKKKTPNYAVTPQCQSEFTPIDSGIVVSQHHLESFIYEIKCNGMTIFMEFMI